MIQTSTTEIQSAHRFLNRIRFEMNSVPGLRHVLVALEDGELTLSVASNDLRVEYRIPDAASLDESASFLIPAHALIDASAGGRAGRLRWDVLEADGARVLDVIVSNRSREIKTSHPARDAADFPKRPLVDGPSTALPKETMDAVRLAAPFASRDAKCRGAISGVRLSPENGGAIMATDGRQLVILPATVPDQPFTLPNSAVELLGHEAFNRNLTVTGPNDAWFQFCSGRFTCFARVTADRFPDVQQLVPPHFEASATIPEAGVPPLVAWLRSLKGASACVQLAWDKPGHLVLSEPRCTGQATFGYELPVELDGSPTPVCLKAAHLANALAIGNNLRINGSGMRFVVTSPAGGTCVIVPLRTMQGADAILQRIARVRCAPNTRCL